MFVVFEFIDFHCFFIGFHWFPLILHCFWEDFARGSKSAPFNVQSNSTFRSITPQEKYAHTMSMQKHRRNWFRWSKWRLEKSTLVKKSKTNKKKLFHVHKGLCTQPRFDFHWFPLVFIDFHWNSNSWIQKSQTWFPVKFKMLLAKSLFPIRS